MTKYIALLRGIAPTNPNRRNDKLRGVFEKLGFANVKTVISSGNVVFESPSTSVRKLEDAIEKALPEELGFHSTTIIRSDAGISAHEEASCYGTTEGIRGELKADLVTY